MAWAGKGEGHQRFDYYEKKEQSIFLRLTSPRPFLQFLQCPCCKILKTHSQRKQKNKIVSDWKICKRQRHEKIQQINYG